MSDVAFQFGGRTAVVTGAAGGPSGAVARPLRASGAHVVTEDLHVDDLDRLVQAYGDWKGAVVGLTSLAWELAPKDIRVNGVSPGLIGTRLSAVAWSGGRSVEVLAETPLRRDGEPEEVAGAVVSLCDGTAYSCKPRSWASAGATTWPAERTTRPMEPSLPGFPRRKILIPTSGDR